MAEATAPDSEAEELENRSGKDEAQLAKFWIAEIETATKAQAKWVERGKKVEKVYNDERDASTNRTRKFNVLWSNVETQRPAIFMHTPTPRAVRRYAQKDPVARFTALLIERSLQVSCDQYDFDEEVDQAVRDRLVPGRGQMWVFYDPVIVGEGENEALEYENVTAEYVPWQDFLHSVARTWREVWWVARRCYKSRRELKKWLKDRGLDPRKAATVKLDYSVEGSDSDEGLKDERNKAIIWEIHSKRDGEVLYVAPGSGKNAILGRMPPTVRFRDFFPCPMPMLATTTAKSLIPSPDYIFYQDQAQELDELTARIGLLQKALKVAGVYNAKNQELQSLLVGAELKMVGVDNWAMFAEGGGVKGNIEWYPVEVVAVVIEKLYLAREQAKQTLYEVSGIGDILRGATDPDETATAQGIKAKWGSLRQRRNQKRSTTFLDQIFQLKAEAICQKIPFEKIMQMAAVDEALLEKYVPKAPPVPAPQPPPEAVQRIQMLPPEQQQQAQQVLQQMLQQQQQQAQQVAQMQARAQFLSEVQKLLQDNVARTFRITVQPDSMLEPDRQEQEETATKFLAAIATFMEKVAPMAMQGPEAAKVVGTLLMWAVRRFDKVDELEEALEAFVDSMSEPREPQPDPELMKVKAQIEGDKARLEMDKEAKQQEMGFKKEMHQMDMQAKMQAVQVDGAVKQMEMQQSAVEGQQKLQLQAVQAEQQLRQGEQQGALKQKQGEQAMSLAEKKAAFERSQREGAPPNG